MTMLILDLKAAPGSGTIPGACANCGNGVHESLSTLDDTYNVWAGRCPHCGAINLLSTSTGLRGYHSTSMDLVLPYDEEVEPNGLPAGTPTRGASGVAATMHGSPLGEFLHKLSAAREESP